MSRVFWNPANAFHVALHEASPRRRQRHCRSNLLPLAVSKTEDLDGAFSAILKERPEALLILADRVFLHDREPIMDFATKNRLPSVNAYHELVEAGGLMSYGPSYEDMHRRAAIYVDKILKGAKPGDLPVEQPSKFNLHCQPSRPPRQSASRSRIIVPAARRPGDRMSVT